MLLFGTTDSMYFHRFNLGKAGIIFAYYNISQLINWRESTLSSHHFINIACRARFRIVLWQTSLINFRDIPSQYAERSLSFYSIRRALIKVQYPQFSHGLVFALYPPPLGLSAIEVTSAVGKRLKIDNFVITQRHESTENKHPEQNICCCWLV